VTEWCISDGEYHEICIDDTKSLKIKLLKNLRGMPKEALMKKYRTTNFSIFGIA